MKKALIATLLCLALPVLAGEPVGVVVNTNTNSIQLINPLTMELTPSLLKGNLGSYGGQLLDVVVAPDGKKAFVSNFGDAKIFCIDIAGGFNAEPTIIGEAYTGFFAEDMDITPDGKYLLVTDGGFSSVIGVIDVETMTLVKRYNFPNCYSNCVAVHPSGNFVYSGDYFQGQLYVFAFAEGVLTLQETQYILPSRPVNLAVSPDGQTLIAVGAGTYNQAIFGINHLGNLYNFSMLNMPSKHGQSCVFSADSTKAYFLSNSYNGGTQIHALDVTGPGAVSVAGSLKLSIMRGTSQLFGVDTMALDPSGNYLFVANPTISGGVVETTAIDLHAWSEAAQLKCNGIPTGIAFGTIE